jgi:D-alanine-D-alanine ligase
LDRLRIGVIFGGRSGEHEVSLASARSIMGVLDPDRYEVVPIGISREGRWITSGDPMQRLTGGTAEAAPAAPTCRELVPGASGTSFPRVDVVFPVLHGPYGEDGTVQGLLELADLPYVGCGVLASSLAMDKLAAKAVFAAHGLPQPAYRGILRSDWSRSPEQAMAQVEQDLGYPVFVKPANLGSSIGISKASDRIELAAGLAEAARYDRRLIVESAVPHAREVEVSVMGNDHPVASVPGEILPASEFYDYAAKYLDDRSRLLIPAPLAPEAAEKLRELAKHAYAALDCAGLARVDFLLDAISGEPFLNEINTMPGFTRISMFPKLWEASGVPYTQLIDRLIAYALERDRDKHRSLTRFDGAMSAAPES